jgi:hypothetical protein
MITEDVRTLEVGTTDFVWGRIEELHGVDVTGVAVQLRTVDPAGVASAWANPANEDGTTPPNVIRAAALFTATTPGDYRLQAKLVDAPTTTVITCGLFRVISLP